MFLNNFSLALIRVLFIPNGSHNLHVAQAKELSQAIEGFMMDQDDQDH
jgi:hypothetical protein